MSDLVAIDGEIQNAAKAKISVMDRGFLLGDLIFEVMVAYGKTIICLEEHIKRLHFSAEATGISIPISDQELKFELESILELTNFPISYLRLTITRGPGPGVSPPQIQKNSRIIHCLQSFPTSKPTFENGLKLDLKSQKFTVRGALPKTANYIDSISALSKMNRSHFDDILWYNSSGELTECTSANIFLIGRVGDLAEIATPSVHCGILQGTTRNKIMELLQNAKIPVSERVIYQEEIPRFDEAFICSSVRGLVPIQLIGSHKLYTTRPQSTFRHIHRLYNTWVATTVSHDLQSSSTPKK